jgi:hypothetical protein
MVLNLRSNYPGQSIILITSNSNSQPFVFYSFCTPLICAWKKMIEFGCVAAGWHNMGSRAHHWSCDGGLFCTGKPTNCSQATTLVELKIRLFHTYHWLRPSHVQSCFAACNEVSRHISTRLLIWSVSFCFSCSLILYTCLSYRIRNFIAA